MDAASFARTIMTTLALAPFSKNGSAKLHRMLSRSLEKTLKYCDESGDTIAEIAIAQNRYGTLRIMLDHGMNPDYRREEGGETLLYLATGCGSYQCVKTLLQCNANPDIRADNGGTPLYM